MRNLRNVAVLVSAMALVAVPPAQASHAAAVPVNINASVMPGNNAEDAIAVNPTDPNNVVTMSTLAEADAGLFEGVSFDGGNTWDRSVIGGGPDDPLGPICCDEQMTFDRFGNLWVVYLRQDVGDVFVVLSTDGGRSFSHVFDVRPVFPSSGATSNGNKRIRAKKNLFADQPSIAVGSNSVWVSYTVSPSAAVQASGMQITGPGAFGSFSTPQNVPTGQGHGDYGDTAVGPDGQVMVIYQNKTGGQQGATIFTALDPDGLGPRGFNDPQPFAATEVGGFDYIPAQPDRSVDAEANLAWDRTGGAHGGRLYAIWTQESPNESNDTDIMLQHSDNNGATWSAPVKLNDDATANSQFNPAIALDPSSGAVGISWYDARADRGTGGAGDTDGIANDDAETWATYSTDGGTTFAANFQVSQGASNAIDTASSFDYGDYTHAAFQSGVFIPAWSDNSNSTGDNPDGAHSKLDLYIARVVVF